MSARRPRRSASAAIDAVTARMRIVFIGTGEIGVPALRALLNSRARSRWRWSPSRTNRSGASSSIKPPPIKKAARRKRRFRFLQPARIKDRRAIEEIRALAAGRDRGHGLRPNPAARCARNSADRLFELARVASCRDSAVPRRSRPRSRRAIGDRHHGHVHG